MVEKAAMKAWLHPKFPTIVFDRKDAAEVSENEAQELMSAANRAHPERTWALVKVPDGRNLFVVEGTPKNS
jgi:hypothetical protein